MKDISITPCGVGKYKLNKTLYFKDGTIIKAGFISDGATVPRVLWWLIPPFHPDYIKAVFVHDYWCDRQEYHKADELFSLALRQQPHSKRWRRKVFITGVKAWHFIAYKQNNKPREWLAFLIKKG